MISADERYYPFRLYMRREITLFFIFTEEFFTIVEVKVCTKIFLVGELNTGRKELFVNVDETKKSRVGLPITCLLYKVTDSLC